MKTADNLGSVRSGEQNITRVICRSRRAISNETWIAAIGLDTTESNPSKFRVRLPAYVPSHFRSTEQLNELSVPISNSPPWTCSTKFCFQPVSNRRETFDAHPRSQSRELVKIVFVSNLYLIEESLRKMRSGAYTFCKKLISRSRRRPICRTRLGSGPCGP